MVEERGLLSRGPLLGRLKYFLDLPPALSFHGPPSPALGSAPAAATHGRRSSGA
jgi:hypothetical protein